MSSSKRSPYAPLFVLVPLLVGGLLFYFSWGEKLFGGAFYGGTWRIAGAWIGAVGITLLLGALVPTRRTAMYVVGACFPIAYSFFHFDSFPGLAVTALVMIWALICALPIMDFPWRFKVGLTVAVFLGAALSLWPTANQMTNGKVPIPTYVRDRIPFAIVQGLDLQGGMRLVYTVEVEEAIRDRRDRIADDMRFELARLLGIHSGEALLSRDELTKLRDRVAITLPETALIRLKFRNKDDIGKIDDRFRNRFLPEMSQTSGPGPDELTFKIRTEVESTVRERAVAQAKDTISRRVDELGLREASVTNRDEDIIVEVPGKDEKSFDEIKDIIRKTARLEFKMVDDPANFFGKVEEKDLPEGAGMSVYDEGAPDGPGKSTRVRVVKMLRIKVDANGKPDPNGTLETMPQTLKRFKEWVTTQNVPDDHQVGFEPVREPDEVGTFEELGWRTYYLYNRAEVTGEYITDAQALPNQQGGSGWYVAVTFTPAGADRFEEVTGANVKRRFAIILDDAIESAPVIQTKIGGGHASITMGSADPQTQFTNAKKLELVLKSGALPAPISLSNDSRIGPTLGKDAIGQGVKGMMLGAGCVLLFMLFYYRKSGVVADTAVLFNLFLQLAILASFSATMTLPGICGLALTIGMSVDANVLINERIREELRAGRTVRASVEAGYEKAFSSILDGHVTVFITGLILAQYGTGPIKGFAVALIVGIIASLFTGVFCTRLVFDWWVRGAKVKRLSVGAEF